MRRFVMSALSALVVAGSIAACGAGSGASESAQVQQDYVAFLHGIASGNGSEACDAFTPSVQQRILDGVLAGSKLHSCTQLFTLAAKQESSSDKQKLRTITVKVLSITKDTATIQLHYRSQSRTVRQVIAKYQGRWRLAGVIPST